MVNKCFAHSPCGLSLCDYQSLYHVSICQLPCNVKRRILPSPVDTPRLGRMATGIFRTYSEANLLNMRERLTEALLTVTTGDKAVGISLGGKNYTFTQASMQGIRDMLDEVNFALQLTNSTAYGKRVTHTYPNWQVLTPDNK